MDDPSDDREEVYAVDDGAASMDDDLDEPDDDAPRLVESALSLRERFRLVRKIGEGAFGEVHEGLDEASGERVALKLARLCGVPGNERDDGKSLPKAVLRELWCLQELVGEPHATQYLAHFPRGASLALVLEFCATDLQSVMAERDGGAPLPEAAARRWTRELLMGLEAVHGAGLMHRDVKPSNCLLTDGGVLKLGDFGQARPVERKVLLVDRTDPNYSHQVSTRWYRAPEILFGARVYGPSLDLWAVGVILAELLHNFVLFEGHSDIEQLVVVFKKMGSPSKERWPSASALPDFAKICFPDAEPQDMEAYLPNATIGALDLLGRLLVLEPSKRDAPAAALGRAFFDGPDADRADLAAIVAETAIKVAAKPAGSSRCYDDDDSW